MKKRTLRPLLGLGVTACGLLAGAPRAARAQTPTADQQSAADGALVGAVAGMSDDQLAAELEGKDCVEAAASLVGDPAADVFRRETPEEVCKTWVILVSDRLQPEPATDPGPTKAELQPTPPRAGGDQGEPGSADPIGTLNTVGLAGATFSLVATEAGTRSLTAISVNPAGLSASDPETFARWSRFADLTLLVPIDLDTGQASGDGLDYVGLRLRMNFLGVPEGEEAFRQAKARIRAVYAQDQALQNAYLALLKGAPDFGDCAAALLRNAPDRERVCGGRLPDPTSLEAAEAARKAAMRTIREDADRTYFGLDLSADLGRAASTTTSTAVDGFALNVALAAGHRVTGIWSLQASGGLHYFDPAAAGPASFAIEGGLAASAQWRIADGRQVLFRFGGQGRYVVDNEETRLEPDFVDLRAGFSVPVSESTNLAIGVAVPVTQGEDAGPRLTVSSDLNLLFDD